MQNQIRNRQPLFVPVPVPLEVLVTAGIKIGEPLQFTAEEKRITMENLSTDGLEFVCDGRCWECPMLQSDCIDRREACLCKNNCERSEVR